MAKKQITLIAWLRVSALRLSRIHFIYALAIAIQIIVFDAGKLITPNIVLLRWLAVALLVVAATGVWVLAHNKNNDANFYKLLIVILISADILFAAYSVYLQRGMAARAVFLFVIPVITSTVLLNRAAIYATAIVSAAAYFVAAISYFVLNFNEGYKLELYGEVGLYATLLLVLAGLLSAFVKFKEE
jgi:hypothetical protein